MKICGIYCIRNMVNNKKYIGSSIDINSRWSYHKKVLKINKHDNPYLQSSWNKYGKNNFDFSIVEDCEQDISEDMLIIKEQTWINYYRSYDREYGYNLRDSGRHGRHSEETKQKISKAKKGKYIGINNPFFGKHHSEETKRKLSEINKNPSKELRRKK